MTDKSIPVANTASSPDTPSPAKKTKQDVDQQQPAMPPAESSKPATAKSMLSKAITAAQTSSNSSRSTPRAASTQPVADSTPQAQFVGQEDFIGFDASPPPEPTPRHRHNAAGPGPRSEGKKRKLDEFEERREEGTRNLQKRERERSTPWCDDPGVDWKRADSAIAMLNMEAKAFVHYISPTLPEHELRLTTIELIRRTIQSRWSDADVQCFGSVGTGLYLPGGDIDLVILCPTMPAPPLKPSSSLLHRLASLLLSSSLAEPSSLVVIAKARVPIVKFVTRYGGFSVDLSVNQKNGIDAAVRVRQMLEHFAFREDDYIEPGSQDAARMEKGKGKEVELEQPGTPPVDHGVARSLVLLVKAFLNQRGMNEVFTGGLGSYSIICLVVSFLQLHPKIQTGEINPRHNVGLLFVEFLEYYGKHFNYDEAGITLRGRGGYFNKHNKGWYRPNQPYLLSIEDPNDPSNDVSGGSHNIIRVRQTLAGAFECLAATLSHRVSHFEARRNPAINTLSAQYLPNADYDALDPLQQSVLGSVIGMSRAAIRARDENVRLYENGALQRLLGDSATLLDGSAPSSRKALKRARKEEREKRQRDKTAARLELRQGEREAKRERKDRKKRELEASLAPKSGATSKSASDDENPGFIVDVVGQRPDSIAKTLFPAARAGQDSEDDDAEESRYSIASPGSSTTASAAYKARSAASSRAHTPLYINSRHSDDSDDDSSDDSHDDADVLLGGGTGDMLVGARVAPADGNGDSSDEELERHLVPNGAGSGRKAGPEAAAKKKAKAAFWAAKGKIERD